MVCTNYSQSQSVLQGPLLQRPCKLCTTVPRSLRVQRPAARRTSERVQAAATTVPARPLPAAARPVPEEERSRWVSVSYLLSPWPEPPCHHESTPLLTKANKPSLCLGTVLLLNQTSAVTTHRRNVQPHALHGKNTWHAGKQHECVFRQMHAATHLSGMHKAVTQHSLQHFLLWSTASFRR